MSRRILTKTSIDELLGAGRTELQLQAGDIVTDLAREHAQQRGLRLIPAAGGLRAGSPAPVAAEPTEPPAGTASEAKRAGSPAPVAAEPMESPEETAAEVKRAVIAALGHEPADLDAIIARVVR